MKKPHTSSCAPLVPRPGAQRCSAAPRSQTSRQADQRHEHVEAVEEAQLRDSAPGRARSSSAGAEVLPASGTSRRGSTRSRAAAASACPRACPSAGGARGGAPPTTADRAAPPSAQQREDELGGARGLEGAVREVAVVEGRDREHAHEVQADRQPDRERAPADPEHAEAGEVQQRRRARRAASRSRASSAVLLLVLTGPGVEPAHQGQAQATRAAIGGRAHFRHRPRSSPALPPGCPRGPATAGSGTRSTRSRRGRRTARRRP